jgi:2-polyprenyl-3-methyl-5-hydroxy-6-metoxy-1,4-benzoquinol methylase
VTTTAQEEIASGQRFAFGENWRRFLEVLTDERIRDAEQSLRTMLEAADLRGRTFLDIGSGSGLFSLAARRLGARVHSFDFDPKSVACTQELRHRYFPDDPEWRIEQGSVLDPAFVRSLGQFDVVYSWGVLHHTGDMWKALEHAALAVAPGGRLFIAIYNDQGATSRRWLAVKRIYCSGFLGRAAMCAAFIPYFAATGFGNDVRQRRNPLHRYTRPTKRGMSVFRDWFDWLGGLPFEVASVEAIVTFYKLRRFELRKLTTDGLRLGNNEFVFERPPG